MRHSARLFLTHLLALVACGATVASAQTVGPYTVTFDLPSCQQPIVTGTSPNFVLTCGTGLHCIAQGPSGLRPPGTPINLSAACAPAATTVTWEASRDCTVPAPGASTSVNEATGPKNCVYTAVATAGALSGRANVNVNWDVATGGGTAPQNCSAGAVMSANGAPVPLAGLPSSGGAITLQGSCTGTVTSWTWRKTWPGNNLTGWAATPNAPDTLPVNATSSAISYTYGLTACNGTACAAEVTRTIPVAGATGGGGGGFCASYPTVSETSMAGLGTIYSHQTENGLAGNGVYVVAFTLPAGAPTNSYEFRVSEWVDGGVSRHITVSTEKCDFRLTAPPDGALTHGAGLTAVASFGGPSGMFPQLAAGQVYYLNVRNWDFSANGGQGGVSCSSATCNVVVSFAQR